MDGDNNVTRIKRPIGSTCSTYASTAAFELVTKFQVASVELRRQQTPEARFHTGRVQP